ncbi:hypothetical protein OG21DRAFT_1525759 [Imleria badia]|nr:hypothetical protein OG21DRAFT_1525759 [Imleria badia]
MGKDTDRLATRVVVMPRWGDGVILKDTPSLDRYTGEIQGQLRYTSVFLHDDDVCTGLRKIASLVAARITNTTSLSTQIIPRDLSFWKLHEPLPLSRPLLPVPISLPLEDIAKPLDRNDPVGPHVSRGDADALVSLVVRWTPTILQWGKRAREKTCDVVELVNRANFANEPPSKLAQPSYFRAWHRDPDKWMIDHRRACDEPPDAGDDLLPISLQYEGFGHFLDVFRGLKNVPGVEGVLSAGIQSAVNYFADQMSLIYPDEELRKNDGLLALNCIFSLRTDSHCIQLTEPATEVSPYGHIFRVGPHKAASCIAVFKNELADDTPIPYVEMTSHFAHTTREATLDSVSRSVMRRWNFPCLGITIVGHCVTFYAMIYFGQWRVVALTPALSCIRASGDGDDRNALYKAFTAASVLLARIDQDAAQLVATCQPQ